MAAQTPFVPTNSWCYHFARYQAIPEILTMHDVETGGPFRLVERVKRVMDVHLTAEQQAMQYSRRDTKESISIANTIKWYVPFVAKQTEQLVPLGDGMYRVPSIADVDAQADEAEEAEAAVGGEDADAPEFDGWVYAFSFPSLIRDNEPFPIKVGMTIRDVDVRVLGQCRGSATFDTPKVLGRWKVSRVNAVESAVHQVLKARGKWRDKALGSEWFDANLAEIEAIIRFVTQT